MAINPVTGQEDDGSAPDLEAFAKSIAGAFSQVGDFSWLKVNPTNFVVDAIALLLSIPLYIFDKIIILAAKTLAKVIQSTGPEVAELASVALSEVFGTSVTVSPGRGGLGGEEETIGQTVLNQLLGPAIAQGAGSSPI